MRDLRSLLLCLSFFAFFCHTNTVTVQAAPGDPGGFIDGLINGPPPDTFPGGHQRHFNHRHLPGYQELVGRLHNGTTPLELAKQVLIFLKETDGLLNTGKYSPLRPYLSEHTSNGYLDNLVWAHLIQYLELNRDLPEQERLESKYILRQGRVIEVEFTKGEATVVGFTNSIETLKLMAQLAYPPLANLTPNSGVGMRSDVLETTGARLSPAVSKAPLVEIFYDIIEPVVDELLVEPETRKLLGMAINFFVRHQYSRVYDLIHLDAYGYSSEDIAEMEQILEFGVFFSDPEHVFAHTSFNKSVQVQTWKILLSKRHYQAPLPGQYLIPDAFLSTYLVLARQFLEISGELEKLGFQARSSQHRDLAESHSYRLIESPPDSFKARGQKLVEIFGKRPSEDALRLIQAVKDLDARPGINRLTPAVASIVSYFLVLAENDNTKYYAIDSLRFIGKGKFYSDSNPTDHFSKFSPITNFLFEQVDNAELFIELVKGDAHHSVNQVDQDDLFFDKIKGLHTYFIEHWEPRMRNFTARGPQFLMLERLVRHVLSNSRSYSELVSQTALDVVSDLKHQEFAPLRAELLALARENEHRSIRVQAHFNSARQILGGAIVTCGGLLR